ncbi:MAG: periplasmic heavy metal sensor [Candidatus Margulisiibacteriota bacterium]
MRKSYRMIGVCVLGLIGVLFLSGFSFPPGKMGGNLWKGGHPNPEKIAEKLSDELKLTPEQRQLFATGIKEVEKKAKTRMQQDRELSKKMESELSQDRPDLVKIKGYIDQISRNRAEVQFMRTQFLVEFRKNLSPDQVAKLKAMLAKGPGKRGPREK